MKLKKLADVAKRTGYPVVEVEGWLSRGYSGQELDSVKGVLCHHTAGPKGSNKPSFDICKDGRSDLPGPLCHFLVGRDSTIYVMAGGLANHAGKGESPNHTNSVAVGIEVENDGVGEKWEEWLLDCYAKLCNELIKEYDLDVSEVLGHKEHAPGRKSDPTFEMGMFRGLVKDNGNGFLEDKGLDEIPNRDKEGKVGKPKDDDDKDKVKDDNGGGGSPGGKVDEEDLEGMSSYKKRKELEEKIEKSGVKIEDADRENLTIEELESLASLDSSLTAGQKTATDYASSAVSFIGIAGMMYSVLLFFAYLFDTTNNITEGSVVKAMTGGRLESVHDPEDVGKDGKTTKIAMKGAFKYALIGVLFSLVIVSGTFFGWTEAAITFLITKFGGNSGG